MPQVSSIPLQLLTDQQLESSPVVANNRMNRERALFGINSYQKELGLETLSLLQKRAAAKQDVRWMDLCCGNGNALLQAAKTLHSTATWPHVYLEGLDLVGLFPPIPDGYRSQLRLQAGAVTDWQPSQPYDLVTCVHGIHYLGDKLGLIQKVLAHLKPNGLFAFNFDMHNFRDAQGQPMVAWWKGQCNQSGWTYDARRHLLQIHGRQDWPQTWQYLGASDEAGPNYSGQAAVNSFYQV
jgi:SAM-dependent methyltransferase